MHAPGGHERLPVFPSSDNCLSDWGKPGDLAAVWFLGPRRDHHLGDTRRTTDPLLLLRGSLCRRWVQFARSLFRCRRTGSSGLGECLERHAGRVLPLPAQRVLVLGRRCFGLQTCHLSMLPTKLCLVDLRRDPSADIIPMYAPKVVNVW